MTYIAKGLSIILYTFYIHSISILCYKIVILFICYYNGNARLNYVKTWIDITYRNFRPFTRG